MTAPPLLPASSPAARPGRLGLPGPSWPPADFEYQDVWSDTWSDTWGVLVITTPPPVTIAAMVNPPLGS
jgi:hypothetical protein